MIESRRHPLVERKAIAFYIQCRTYPKPSVMLLILKAFRVRAQAGESSGSRICGVSHDSTSPAITLKNMSWTAINSASDSQAAGRIHLTELSEPQRRMQSPSQPDCSVSRPGGFCDFPSNALQSNDPGGCLSPAYAESQSEWVCRSVTSIAACHGSQEIIVIVAELW